MYECFICGKDYNPWVRSSRLIDRIGASHSAHIIAKAKADLARHESKHASGYLDRTGKRVRDAS